MTRPAPQPRLMCTDGYHQQYLHKAPKRYGGTGGTGLSCPVGVAPPSGA